MKNENVTRVALQLCASPAPDHTARLPRAAALIGHAVRATGRRSSSSPVAQTPRTPAHLQRVGVAARPHRTLDDLLSRHTRRHLVAPTGRFRRHRQARLEQAFSLSPSLRRPTSPPLAHRSVTPPLVPIGDGAPPAARGFLDRFGPPAHALRRYSAVAAVWRNWATSAWSGPARGRRGEERLPTAVKAAVRHRTPPKPPTPRVARVPACVLQAALVG